MLAIVIPYYNIAFLEQTLLSLQSQTDQRFNVYIGDDASPDNPTEIISNYQTGLNSNYVRFDENLGGSSLVKQWERCVDLIQEEQWIMILGDDDVLGSECIAEFYKNLDTVESQKINLIRFASAYSDKSGERISEVYKHPIIEKTTDAYFRHFTGVSRSSLSEHIFRRSAYVKYRFTDFPLAWHSDDKAWLDFTQCNNLYTINDAVVNVRVSESSISGKSDNLLMKQKARLLFIEDLVTKKFSFFNKLQKATFLLEYGVLLKKAGKLNLEKGFFIGLRLLKIGAFMPFLKFFRRYWIHKFKSA
jgi:glycosyltransferase involved in cell wall biosynthesis